MVDLSIVQYKTAQYIPMGGVYIQFFRIYKQVSANIMKTMMRIKYFPFFIVKRYRVYNESLDKFSDRDILEYIFKELEKEEFKRNEFTGTTIELEGDHAGIYSNFNPIKSATQSIDYGRIFVETKKRRRKIVYKFQMTIFTIPCLLIGIISGLLFRMITVGLIIFIISFVFSWLWTYIIHSMMISSFLDRLIYNEHWKGRNKIY